MFTLDQGFSVSMHPHFVSVLHLASLFSEVTLEDKSIHTQITYAKCKHFLAFKSKIPTPLEHQQYGLYMPNVKNIWHLSPKTAQQWECHIAYAKIFLRFSYSTISNVRWYCS